MCRHWDEDVSIFGQSVALLPVCLKVSVCVCVSSCPSRSKWNHELELENSDCIPGLRLHGFQDVPIRCSLPLPKSVQRGARAEPKTHSPEKSPSFHLLPSIKILRDNAKIYFHPCCVQPLQRTMQLLDLPLEILVAILNKLTFTDIFSCQRVSRRLRGIIADCTS